MWRTSPYLEWLRTPSNEWVDFPFENNPSRRKYSVETAGNNLVIGNETTKLSRLAGSDGPDRRRKGGGLELCRYRHEVLC
jgi:hypothetical protein